MKLCYFNDYSLGVVLSNGVVDITEMFQNVPVRSRQDLMAILIENFADWRARIEEKVKGAVAIGLDQVSFRAPLPSPRMIACMAVNYDDGLLSAPDTNAFHKSPSAIIGPGEEMVLPDVPASVFEGEAEIAIVIGKRSENVRPEDAMDHVFGYMNFVDGSARDLLPKTNSFFQMKSRQSFAPTGPYIVTADEIANPQALDIRLWVNGDLKQEFNTAKMVTGIRNSIAWLSAIQTLLPGDIVATGTDHRGLNAFQDRDVVELEADGLGRLKFSVRDDLKRTWSRETRFERHSKGLPMIAPQLTGKYGPAAE